MKCVPTCCTLYKEIPPGTTDQPIAECNCRSIKVIEIQINYQSTNWRRVLHGHPLRWKHNDGASTGQGSLVLPPKMTIFSCPGLVSLKWKSFQKAGYRKSLVKDDVYGETMDEEYMLNY